MFEHLYIYKIIKKKLLHYYRLLLPNTKSNTCWCIFYYNYLTTPTSSNKCTCLWFFI